ncbi:hypothetical protein LXT21_11110 [Myxococcus sp. K38C18041901]|uniref:hypothetical protein n=1 Tax=Myxococcus guangdongensis TaxID=2906760 RepID=UPI0020A786A2|nr:hypothetical protein [Myxococcus guangdongensis]MCP3059322.1 hypothetical protein [Myxococcus guangdongensis]
MRARAGLMGVVLGAVLVSLGICVSVPPGREAPAAEPLPVATPPSPVMKDPPKAMPEPALRVEQVKGAAGATVQVAGLAPADSALTRFAKEALVPLTAEEQALLREESVDDLSALVARTERAFLDATPETRARLERRYLAALDLVAKLSAPPTEDTRAREVDARYRQALAREQEKWRELSPEERARAQDTFKEWFFQGEQTR